MYFISVDVAYMKPDRRAIYNNVFGKRQFLTYMCIYVSMTRRMFDPK